jgi:hypothetical protein
LGKTAFNSGKRFLSLGKLGKGNQIRNDLTVISSARFPLNRWRRIQR